MSKSLIIAEKPSVARDLARALGKFRTRRISLRSDEYVISSAVGHLVEMVPPEGAEVKRGKWNIRESACPCRITLIWCQLRKTRRA